VSFESLTEGAIRLQSRRPAGRSRSVGRQPGKPGWRMATVVNLTGGTARRLVPAEGRGRRPRASYPVVDCIRQAVQQIHNRSDVCRKSTQKKLYKQVVQQVQEKNLKPASNLRQLDVSRYGTACCGLVSRARQVAAEQCVAETLVSAATAACGQGVAGHCETCHIGKIFFVLFAFSFEHILTIYTKVKNYKHIRQTKPRLPIFRVSLVKFHL